MKTKLATSIAYLEDGMRQGLHIGAQVCVMLRGEIVADFAIGLAREGQPMRSDHRILWLSAGKPLLAVALMQLWERGLVSLDAPVSQYLPEFSQHGKDAVFVQHLLTHTHAYQPPAVDWPRLGWDEIIASICAARIPEGRVPGDYAAYDPQTGWYLLAEILQRLTGRRFYEYLQAEVLQAAGCEASSIGMGADQYKDLVAGDQLALLHDTTVTARAGQLNEGLAPVWAGDNAARAAAHNPGGGAVGPAKDLCRFYAALGEALKGSDSKKLLNAKTLRFMTSRVRAGLLDHSFKQRVDWGLGFLINSRRYGGEATPYGYGTLASDSTFGHGGVQSTTAYYDPECGLAVACKFNGLPGEAKHNKRVRDFNTLLYTDLKSIL